MVDWIWPGIIVVTSVVIWRKARRRSGGATVHDGSMDNASGGYASLESQVRGQNVGGDHAGGFGL